MGFNGQYATGESLISLEHSRILQEFKGQIRFRTIQREKQTLEPIQVPSSSHPIRTVVAIDGSIVTDKVRNGFPGAEISLVQIALVLIKLDEIRGERRQGIIPPEIFNRMDEANTVQVVLPGCNIEKERPYLPPKKFFRESVFEILGGSIEDGHETLRDTYEDMVSERNKSFSCPAEACEKQVPFQRGISHCPTCGEIIYSTDVMRFHERFNDTASNKEAHGEVMRFLEIILLINALRFYVSNDDAVQLLPQIAFVADGPLAAFGQYASIAPRVRKELTRLDGICREKTGEGILLMSLIKTGTFVDHFEEIDYSQTLGPGGQFAPGTVLLPDIRYIHENIVLRPPDAKPWGDATYFGRMVLYKNRSSQRMVINTPRVTTASNDLTNTSLAAYPRLPDAIAVADTLATYLFEGGFIPLVRAHAHAAIPLRTGGDLLKELLK